MKKIGLTLGGGGAKGFAHIPILEVFDELGVKPAFITGTSIGAILGALYSSGHSAADIVKMIRKLIDPANTSLRNIIQKKASLKFLELIDPHFSLKPQGLLKGEKFLSFLYDEMQVLTFEELNIPLSIVATDFWRKEQVVFESGDLLAAIRASMAMPYLFTPVMDGDRVLVDGGMINNVPHDLLSPHCDIRIAVNVSGTSSQPMNKVPSPRDAVLHTYQVLLSAMAAEKRANHPVDIYVEPPLVDIDMLDFHRAWEIYEQARAAKDDFKRQLEQILVVKKSRLDWMRYK